LYNSIWVKKDTRGDDEASHQVWLSKKIQNERISEVLVFSCLSVYDIWPPSTTSHAYVRVFQRT